jgi:hypothetical protein
MGGDDDNELLKLFTKFNSHLEEDELQALPLSQLSQPLPLAAPLSFKFFMTSISSWARNEAVD